MTLTVKEYQDKYRNDPVNKAKALAYAAEYRAKNRERILAQVRAWQDANRQRTRDMARAWQRANPKRVCRNTINRRVRKRAAGTHTYDDLLAQLRDQSGLCFYCSEPLGDAWEAEHVIPLSAGGSNDPENIVCACGTCNRRKGAKPMVLFLVRLHTERKGGMNG